MLLKKNSNLYVDVNEVVNQRSIVQYVQEICLEKSLIENSVEDVVVSEKQFRMLKNANVTMVEFVA